MVEARDAMQAYVRALQEPTPAHLDALSDALAPDVVVIGMFGAGDDRDAIRTALEAPGRQGMLAAAQISESALEGGEATIELRLPPAFPLGGLILHLSFTPDGLIRRVEQGVLPAPPPAPIPLVLTDEVKKAVAGALGNGTPVVVAYVDADGAPHLSLRGSTQPFSDTELAIWVRDPDGGLVRALPLNPRVALFYRDPASRASYQFAGRGRVETSPEVRDAVYAGTPAAEQNLDARRRGVAVVIDLDRVEGSGPGGRFVMTR